MPTFDHPRARRDLELIPIEHEGQKLVLIRDALGLVPQGTAILPPMLEFMALLDGERSLDDLAVELGQAMGEPTVASGQLESLVEELSKTGLLEDERFLKTMKAHRAEFEAATRREPAHAGDSYPEDAEELAEFLQGIIDASPPPEAPGPLKALVAPHVEIAVGRQVYGQAYRALASSGFRPKRVVILGVGHTMSQGLFCPCHKDFQTPLGLAQTDAAAAAALAKAAGPALALDDYPHRDEHSIEFQLVFLQQVLGADSFSIVPVLCGNLQHGLSDYSRNGYLETAGGFLEALAGLARDPETLLVAGVDMSHIGPKFGHQQTADELSDQAGAHDRALLAALAEGDPQALWAESVRVSDGYNVCGFSALAALLETMGPGDNRVINYQMMHEEPTSSAVGFAAASLSPEG